MSQVDLVADVPPTDPSNADQLASLVEECGQLFTAVTERSSHLRGEIESQYGSRPADPEVLHPFFHFFVSAIKARKPIGLERSM